MSLNNRYQFDDLTILYDFAAILTMDGMLFTQLGSRFVIIFEVFTNFKTKRGNSVSTFRLILTLFGFHQGIIIVDNAVIHTTLY